MWTLFVGDYMEDVQNLKLKKNENYHLIKKTGMIKPRSQTIESIGYPPTGHVIEILSPATEVMFGIRLIVGRPYTLIRAVCCMVATSLIAWQVYRPPSDRKEKKDDEITMWKFYKKKITSKFSWHENKQTFG